MNPQLTSSRQFVHNQQLSIKFGIGKKYIHNKTIVSSLRRLPDKVSSVGPGGLDIGHSSIDIYRLGQVLKGFLVLNGVAPSRNGSGLVVEGVICLAIQPSYKVNLLIKVSKGAVQRQPISSEGLRQGQLDLLTCSLSLCSKLGSNWSIRVSWSNWMRPLGVEWSRGRSTTLRINLTWWVTKRLVERTCTSPLGWSYPSTLESTWTLPRMPRRRDGSSFSTSSFVMLTKPRSFLIVGCHPDQNNQL